MSALGRNPIALVRSISTGAIIHKGGGIDDMSQSHRFSEVYFHKLFTSNTSSGKLNGRNPIALVRSISTPLFRLAVNGVFAEGRNPIALVRSISTIGGLCLWSFRSDVWSRNPIALVRSISTPGVRGSPPGRIG